MTNTADAEHFALMARSGLMTHVVEITPPLTAAAVARFRSEVADQASNVMALASGRFAICLPAGRTELRTSVPHRLIAVGAVRDDPGSEESPHAADPAAGPPRRILPPSLRGETPQAPPPRPSVMAHIPAPNAPIAPPEPGPEPMPAAAPEATTPTPAPATSPLVAPQPEAPHPEPALTLETLAEGQVALAEGMSRLAEILAQAERRADAQAAALERLAPPPGQPEPDPQAQPEPNTGLARTRADGVASALTERLDHLSDTMRAAAEAQTRALEARLTEGIEAAFTAQSDAVGEMRRAIDTLAAAHADEAARLGESLATLRLGLRAVNDRLSGQDAEPRVTSAPTGVLPAPRVPPPSLATRESASRPAGAGLAGIGFDGNGMATASPAESGDLRGAVQTLLGRIDWLEAGATAAVEHTAIAPVWRRAHQMRREEAG